MENKDKILYWSPRVLAILFGGFLCLFALDSFDELNGWKTIFAAVMHLMIPAIVALATIISWKKDLAGAIIFFFFAIYYVSMVGLDRHWSWYASISGPALITALLFFINWRHSKKPMQ